MTQPDADQVLPADQVAGAGAGLPASGLAAGDPLSPEAQQAKDEFISVRGTWGESWEAIARLDPAFLHAYTTFSGLPFRDGGVLDAKVKEFIFIAIDSAATHLYTPGIRQHVRAALDVGATPAEIMEVLELTATLGIHACNVGVPLLLEVLREEGLLDQAPPLDERRQQLKQDFQTNRGYWNEIFDGILQLDPDLLEAYTQFSSVPWESGTLDPKVKEMIYIAFDASATHLFAPGLKLHLRNAIRYGATVPELMELLAIVSVIGIHAVTTAAPILAEELRATAQ